MLRLLPLFGVIVSSNACLSASVDLSATRILHRHWRGQKLTQGLWWRSQLHREVLWKDKVTSLQSWSDAKSCTSQALRPTRPPWLAVGAGVGAHHIAAPASLRVGSKVLEVSPSDDTLGFAVHPPASPGKARLSPLPEGKPRLFHLQKGISTQPESSKRSKTRARGGGG